MIRAPVIAERVAEGDRPAVGVQLLDRDVALVHDRDHLGGEGLVELDGVDVAIVIPARSSTFLIAPIGATPMYSGSLP